MDIMYGLGAARRDRTDRGKAPYASTRYRPLPARPLTGPGGRPILGADVECVKFDTEDAVMAYVSNADERFLTCFDLDGPARRETAIREAERILATAESEPNSLLVGIERVSGAGRPDRKGRVWPYSGLIALAESLSTILPVLDELAEDAHIAYTIEHQYNDDAVCANIDRDDRNRATDAALDAR